MPTFLERLTAQFAFAHARAVFRRFSRDAQAVKSVQHRLLQPLLSQSAASEFGRRFNFKSIRSLAEFKRAVPILTYEDMRPFIDRVADGNVQALFNPRERIRMFATSSGSTDQPKLIPVTQAFVREYRRGWNTFGCKLLTDHPRAVLRSILQSSGRFDESRTRSGVPCGAITGLLARTQKRIVRRFYVAPPEVSEIGDIRARYYTLMRLGIARDVAFAVTANPATLVQLARTVDDESETLIQDVHDGTLSRRFAVDERLHAQFLRRLRPDPLRARELQRSRSEYGALLPRHYWHLEFLACWLGGSMGLYLERVRKWYGEIPIRDVGLLASEGRVTIPFDDGLPSGVLDVAGAIFEFIPLEGADSARPETLFSWELETGRDYVVVLSNAAGLFRYRLDDVVRMRGSMGQAPVLEFLHRAGRVSSIAGEKLTESQLVQAVADACIQLGLPQIDFVAAPCWDDPPYYRLTCDCSPRENLGRAIDQALALKNDEYSSRRKSFRLAELRVRYLPPHSIHALDQSQIASRGAKSEQFKRQCLFASPSEDDLWLARAGLLDTANSASSDQVVS